MSVSNAELLVVQALPASGATEGFTTVCAELVAAGVRPTLIPAEVDICDCQYNLAFSPSRPSRLNALAERQRPVLARVGGLLVVNDVEEDIRASAAQGAERICGIPNSVGYVAARLMGMANAVYGTGSGRVFLSHQYPDVSELSGAGSRQAVIRARSRIAGLYPLRPKALQGDPTLAIEAAKTPRPRA